MGLTVPNTARFRWVHAKPKPEGVRNQIFSGVGGEYCDIKISNKASVEVNKVLLKYYNED